MRASFWVIGPLLARAHEARVSLPGGCAIGTRPVDLFLYGLKELGAEIEIDEGYVVAARPRAACAAPASIFPKVTVGATHVIMMAATLARGTTVIENAAMEPEITDVAECLVKMGARITGIGTRTLTIEGVDELHGATHEVSPIASRPAPMPWPPRWPAAMCCCATPARASAARARCPRPGRRRT